MGTNPPQADGRVSVGVLRAEIGHLREFIGARIDELQKRMAEMDRKVDASCGAMDLLEKSVQANSTALILHEQRLTHLERFQAGFWGAIVKWGSVGAGVAITMVLIVAGLTKAWGWW